ncbi:MAG: hypothetical protein ACO1N6_09360 [Microcella sp.]
MVFDPSASSAANGKIEHVAGFGELELNKDLRSALKTVLGEDARAADPIVVLAAYIYSLRSGLGLSEHYERNTEERTHVAPPVRATEFVCTCLGIAPDELTVSTVGDCLYGAFSLLADDPAALSLLNRKVPLQPGGLLLVAQVGWNLEKSDSRSRLPIPSGQPLGPGKPHAHIKVPGESLDFAALGWTERTNRGVRFSALGHAGQSSGQGLRSKVALLAVLAAWEILRNATSPAPELGGATLSADREKVVWPREDRDGRNFGQIAAMPGKGTRERGRTLIGDFYEVGGRYQSRGFDALIHELWNDGGDRRLWLYGGPGLGKSYAARKVMQDALQNQSTDPEQLLIWIDAADAGSVIRELAHAADGIPYLARPETDGDTGRDSLQAHALLRYLATTDARWLVVLDNAEPESLIAQRLIPSGSNPNGRVLITTTSRSAAITGNGRQIAADVFSQNEADEFLSKHLPSTTGALRRALAEATGHHPLALSIATSTIAENYMEVEDWLGEFGAHGLDEVADFPDSGGYPKLIRATWRVALEKASRGMPDGVIERAAMVAAIQNPDGHPTWLWQCEAVLQWVYGENEIAQPGTKIPLAVKRLLDHSILALAGNSWAKGKVSIHRLAARAIQEIAEPERLKEIAAIIADQWLLRLTDDPAQARHQEVVAAIDPISRLRCISKGTRRAVAALLAYAQPKGNPFNVIFQRELLRPIEPYLLNGGVTGRAEAAGLHTQIGIAEQELGLNQAARASFMTAADIYTQLIRSTIDDVNLLVQCLTGLADAQELLGLPDSAKSHRQQALRVLQQAAPSGRDPEKGIRNALSTFDLHQQLDDDAASRKVLDQVMAAVGASTEPGSDTSFDQFDRLFNIGSRLISVGRLEEAFEVLTNAANRLQSAEVGDSIIWSRKIEREIARVHFLRKEWSQAERLLANSGDLVLLASVQMQQDSAGNESAGERARATLRTVAKQIRQEQTETPEEALARARASVDEADLESLRGTASITLWNLLGKASSERRWSDAADLSLGCLEMKRSHTDASTIEHQRDLAGAYRVVAVVSSQAGRSSATQYAQDAVSIMETLTALDPSNRATTIGLIDALLTQGDIGVRFGLLEDAEQAGRHAARLMEELDPKEAAAMDSLLNLLAACSRKAGDLPSAIEQTRQLVAHRRAALPGRDPSKALADSLASLSTLCAGAEDWLAAEPPAVEQVQILDELREQYPKDHELQEEFAVALRLSCMVRYRISQTATNPESHYLDLIDIAQRTVAAWDDVSMGDPSDLSVKADLAVPLFILAIAFKETGQQSASVDALWRAANNLQLPAELDPTSHKEMYLMVLRELEVALRDVGRVPEAERIAARAEQFNSKHSDDPPYSED